MSTKKPDLKSQRWAVERLHIEEMRLRDELSNLHEQQRTLAEEYVKAIRREIRKQVKVRLSMVDYTAFSPVSMIWNTKHGGCVWLGFIWMGRYRLLSVTTQKDHLTGTSG